MNDAIVIRDVVSTDWAIWARLWSAYNAFYDVAVEKSISTRTWERMLDSNVPMFGRIAEYRGSVVGFCICVLHEGTWVDAPICYLEDLFVDPSCRGLGIGRRLISDLVEQGKSKAWSRLYWHTRQDNPARKLYDEFASADDFVRYRLSF